MNNFNLNNKYKKTSAVKDILFMFRESIPPYKFYFSQIVSLSRISLKETEYMLF